MNKAQRKNALKIKLQNQRITQKQNQKKYSNTDKAYCTLFFASPNSQSAIDRLVHEKLLTGKSVNDNCFYGETIKNNNKLLIIKNENLSDHQKIMAIKNCDVTVYFFDEKTALEDIDFYISKSKNFVICCDKKDKLKKNGNEIKVVTIDSLFESIFNLKQIVKTIRKSFICNNFFVEDKNLICDFFVENGIVSKNFILNGQHFIKATEIKSKDEFYDLTMFDENEKLDFNFYTESDCCCGQSECCEDEISNCKSDCCCDQMNNCCEDEISNCKSDCCCDQMNNCCEDEISNCKSDCCCDQMNNCCEDEFDNCNQDEINSCCDENENKINSCCDENKISCCCCNENCLQDDEENEDSEIYEENLDKNKIDDKSENESDDENTSEEEKELLKDDDLNNSKSFNKKKKGKKVYKNSKSLRKVFKNYKSIDEVKFLEKPDHMKGLCLVRNVQNFEMSVEKKHKRYFVGEKITVRFELGDLKLENLKFVCLCNLYCAEGGKTIYNLSYTSEEPIFNGESLLIDLGIFTMQRSVLISKSINSDVYRKIGSSNKGTISFLGPLLLNLSKITIYKNDNHALNFDNFLCYAGLLSHENVIFVERHLFKGKPYKINKRYSVIKGMFGNRDDVNHFKKFEVKSNKFNTGIVKEPVGTRGLFKAYFNRPIKHGDEVTMHVFKRVFPFEVK